MATHLPEDQIDEILSEAEALPDRFVTPEGPAVFDSPAHVVSGRTPN